MRTGAVLLVALASIFSTTGCSVSGGAGDPSPAPATTPSADARSELQQMIREELPGQLTSGGPAYVDGVGCISVGVGAFECLATVHTATPDGRLRSERVAITAHCDLARCLWRVIG